MTRTVYFDWICILYSQPQDNFESSSVIKLFCLDKDFTIQTIKAKNLLCFLVPKNQSIFVFFLMRKQTYCKKFDLISSILKNIHYREINSFFLKNEKKYNRAQIFWQDFRNNQILWSDDKSSSATPITSKSVLHILHARGKIFLLPYAMHLKGSVNFRTFFKWGIEVTIFVRYTWNLRCATAWVILFSMPKYLQKMHFEKLKKFWLASNRLELANSRIEVRHLTVWATQATWFFYCKT